ncbi:MAG: hypothetical protein ABIJ17_04145 [Patescibacteria group bacterium]
MKKDMVGDVPGSVLGMLADLNLKLRDGSKTPKQLERFLKGLNPFEGLDYSIILNDWEKFFFKVHNLKVDFAGVSIPKADDNDFSWFACSPENFSTERAFSGGKKLSGRWKWTKESLDDVLDLSFGRDSKKDPYIVRFRANLEANQDETLKNLSADQIKEKGINTGTLKERILLGDFILWRFKKHLDMKSWTLCSGSRYSDGFVPDVSWHSDYDKFSVYYYHPVSADPSLRARRVVSF